MACLAGETATLHGVTCSEFLDARATWMDFILILVFPVLQINGARSKVFKVIREIHQDSSGPQCFYDFMYKLGHTVSNPSLKAF